jgi:hypothetical protein
MKRACKITAGRASLALAIALPIALAMPARADNHEIAQSAKLKVIIDALGGTAWCGPQVTLYMDIDPASPLVGHAPAQIALMNKVGGIIAAQCPQALSGEFITQVMTPGATTAAGSYIASAASGWQFSAAPSPALQPQVTAPSAAPLPEPAPVAAQPPAAPSFTLPTYTNYAALLLRYVKDNPAEASDPILITWWTSQAFPDQYSQLQDQQFKLQPLLQQGQANLAQAVSQVGDTVVVEVQTSLQQYDFHNNQYPLQLGNGPLTLSPPWLGPTSPVRVVQLNVDLADLPALPISQAAASAYETAHTNSLGGVNRDVIIALSLKLTPGAFANQPADNPTATATIDSAAVYAPPGLSGQNNPAAETPIAIVTSDEIAALRNAKAAAAAAAEQAQRLAQRSANIQMVSGFSNDEKLYNWLNDTQIQASQLTSIAQARFNSIAANQPVNVSMIVKTDGSGRDNISTSWPNHLILNAAGATLAFSGSSWYLVSGNLVASTKPDDLSSTLAVENAYRCTQDRCAEALDPAAIVDRYDASQNH